MQSPSRPALYFVSLLALVAASASPALPQQSETEDTVLIVGTKDAPPFAMKSANGRWTGISIELWEEIAEVLGLRFEYREYDLPGLLGALREGDVDVGVAALTATGERELLMDFTHPFYTTGFGIAVPPLQQRSFLASLRNLISGRFLTLVALLILVLLFAGSLVWLVERRSNPDFGGSAAEGIWSGFWWAAVTMTTVGYGDKAPKSPLGRILTILWMFTAIVLIGIFLAGMTSALTLSQLESPITGPEDLPRARVATVQASTSEEYLLDNRIPFSYYASLPEAFEAIVDGRIDAVVYDAPLLQYLANEEFRGRVEVLNRTVDHQDYCIALPTGSELREPINRVLLADSTHGLWQEILYRYLQQAPAPPARPQ